MKKLKKIEISIFFLKKKTILHSTSKQTTPIKNKIQFNTCMWRRGWLGRPARPAVELDRRRAPISDLECTSGEPLTWSDGRRCTTSMFAWAAACARGCSSEVARKRSTERDGGGEKRLTTAGDCWRPGDMARGGDVARGAGGDLLGMFSSNEPIQLIFSSTVLQRSVSVLSPLTTWNVSGEDFALPPRLAMRLMPLRFLLSSKNSFGTDSTTEQRWSSRMAPSYVYWADVTEFCFGTAHIITSVVCVAK